MSHQLSGLQASISAAKLERISLEKVTKVSGIHLNESFVGQHLQVYSQFRYGLFFLHDNMVELLTT